LFYFLCNLPLSLVNHTDDIYSFRAYPITFCEPGDHTGVTQCQVIQDMLKKISILADHTPILTLLDIDAIVFDSTGSNTGLSNGLAGNILTRRRELHSLSGGEGEPPDFIIHKCEDHILNLISCDYEKTLITGSPALMVNEKHRATDVVQFIVAKVCFLFYLLIYFLY
jgi:hypothetical protein